MGKLTNKQLEVLSTSIVDKLEEDYEKRRDEFKKSEEYLKTIKELDESDLFKQIDELIELKKDYDSLFNTLNKEIKNKLGLDYFYGDISTWKNRVISNTVKFEERFDREKLLNKVQADILLDSEYDAIETYKKLTAKYAQGTDKELFSK